MLASFGFGQAGKRPLAKDSGSKPVVLVELFTSEGCSSCPPADEAVAALANDYPRNVLVLEFHVDYWNYLGWKDVYSNAAYSKRQEAYAAALALNSIYTPQVVVDGRYQFTGSDKNTLYRVVGEEMKKDNLPMPVLTATATTGGIAVRYTGRRVQQTNLCFALLQLHAVSKVQKGENKGMQLHHTNVVRDFITISNDTETGTLQLPAGLQAKDCRVAAFLQNRNTLHITAASVCDIQ